LLRRDLQELIEPEQVAFLLRAGAAGETAAQAGQSLVKIFEDLAETAGRDAVDHPVLFRE